MDASRTLQRRDEDSDGRFEVSEVFERGTLIAIGYDGDQRWRRRGHTGRG